MYCLSGPKNRADHEDQQSMTNTPKNDDPQKQQSDRTVARWGATAKRQKEHLKERREWWQQQSDPVLQSLFVLHENWAEKIEEEDEDEEDERRGRYLDYCNTLSREQLLEIIHRDVDAKRALQQEHATALGRLVDKIRGVEYPDGLEEAARNHYHKETGIFPWLTGVDEDRQTLELRNEPDGKITTYSWREGSDGKGYVFEELRLRIVK
jgi:hypothetical protein